jgi:DNA-binding NarL/FixJ family response regulator
MTTTFVALVEDDGRIRDAVRHLIDAAPDLACCGAYRTAEDALRGLMTMGADELLLDIHLPGMHGTEAVRLFHERFSGMPVVMFTVFEDDQRIFTSLCNGASGYILKKTPPAKLLDAIREVRDGGSPMSPDIARRVVELFRTFRPQRLTSETLTPAETRLLALLAEGRSYQSAADELGITINTVRNHVRAIYEKLHVHSKSAAVSKALRAGII